ncbi:hypothetical protein RMN57_28625 [Kitasatospora sp. CM 4170]|uniref:Uncharacterized protein n=1 Tax=Kitasatospora aburaviensis TaxID=67265 RepID=A0ABW1F9L3_9ACTN|nr:hypothetical protein [Kitasatospora sp. CM 4170]WNM48366.1 hypothetical protein RMN57_28625 [Kitasatospora sp. CM 4170]
MRQRHSFHLDRGNHSVTVNVRSGWITETELLVDGKELAFHRVHGHGVYPLTLSAQLTGEPPAPVSVRLDRTGVPEHPLACVLELGDATHPMPERTDH